MLILPMLWASSRNRLRVVSFVVEIVFTTSSVRPIVSPWIYDRNAIRARIFWVQLEGVTKLNQPLDHLVCGKSVLVSGAAS